MARPDRRITVLEGPRDRTQEAALALLEGLDPARVAWVSRVTLGETSAHRARPSLRRHLGQSFDVVVLDLHDGLHADVMAAAPGFLGAGGTLVLRLPTEPVPAPHLGAPGAAPPTTHLAERLRLALRERPVQPGPPAPPTAPAQGSEEQGDLIHALTSSLEAPPSLHAVLARRGRGKSTAIGRALALAAEAGHPTALCAPTDAAGAIARAEAGPALLSLSPEEALAWSPRDGPTPILAVDEAAQLPVPWLTAMARRHPTAHLWFATTTGGYEGTGQGFVLRFLSILEHDPRPLHRHRLETPIRWGRTDPLEGWLDRVLLHDAEPADLEGIDADAPLELARVDPARLVDDEASLRQVVGLLQHAHYRTTPADVQRILDAPNLHLHWARQQGAVVAVNLVATEGELGPDSARAMRDGELRIRGHALPDTLVSHLGALPAAGWRWLRSVRLAVHPDRRRRGAARALAEHVHESWPDVDGFGTLFGAVPHVVRFRQALGYRLARLGASRGSRTGEPSAVMVCPVSPRCRALVDDLSARLARDLDLQLQLLHGEGLLPLDPDLIALLRQGMPAPAMLTPVELAEAVRAYVQGPRPLEAAATALRVWLAQSDRSEWTTVERQLADDRLFACRDWSTTARRAGLPHPRAAMRALKRACRRLPLPDTFEGGGPPR